MKTSPLALLVMGVSGSGKSHIGRRLADTINANFIDADDHHSQTSIAKMARGEPLNDSDRQGWLLTLADLYREYREQGQDVVIGCSALKHRYRDLLRQGAPELKILYLHGSREVLLERLGARGNHFFTGEHMLASQLADLEIPEEDEATRMDIRQSPDDIVASFLSKEGIHP
ncbi:gluconokinase [Onishia niordana]|uniref:gluconokinase n=1 Tax=Onishia niordana TaxID=2508711 RepID=UPI0010A052F2|nr:gluconokinase [Halomonas niordiana]